MAHPLIIGWFVFFSFLGGEIVDRLWASLARLVRARVV